MQSEISAGNLRTRLSPRKLLAKATGCGLTTAQKAIAMAKNDEEPNLSAPLGRPPKPIRREYRLIVHDFITQQNLQGVPVTAKLITAFLKNTEFSRSISTVKRDLKKMGFSYGKEYRLNILHNAPGTVAYRELYLRRRLENLNSNGLPILPKVFLD